MNKAFNFIVFDCDGVILDSNNIKTDAFRFTLKKEPAVAVEKFIEWHQANGGVSRQDKFQFYADNFAPNPEQINIDQLLKIFADYCSNALAKANYIPGVENYINAMFAKNIPLYLVSGGSENEIIEQFKSRHIDKQFALIRGNPTSKKDIMKQLYKQGCFVGQGLYFGDAKLDYELAQQYEMEFNFVSGASDWKDGESLMRKNNIKVIMNFTELL